MCFEGEDCDKRESGIGGEGRIEMYKRVLVANRADCAMRLIRGVHDVGAKAVLTSAREDALRRLALPRVGGVGPGVVAV